MLAFGEHMVDAAVPTGDAGSINKLDQYYIYTHATKIILPEFCTQQFEETLRHLRITNQKVSPPTSEHYNSSITVDAIIVIQLRS